MSHVYPDNYTEDVLRKSIEDSCERLGVSNLDLIQLHCIPTEVMAKGDIFDWLRKLKAEGLIKAFGASVHTYEVKSFRSLINFYHKTWCYLPTLIWIDAINKGYFVGWPGLTADRVRKFCKQKEETAKGHMRQLLSNIRSTQKDLMPLPQQKSKSNARRIGTIAFDKKQMKNMIGVDFMG